MFNFFKKPKVSTPLFVASAIATFILLGVLFIYLRTVINSFSFNQINHYPFKNLAQTDPLMTRVPNINNVLAGPIVSGKDPQLGLATAPVTIVEFSDFICQYCQAEEKNIASLIALYPDKIRLIWKDYPETDENSLSFKAALAARCAAEQNSFWPYHDLLYGTTNLTMDDLTKLANNLKLNLNQFKTCQNDDKIKTLVRDNIEEANALAIQGIPFIYINNQELMGEATLEDLKKMIKTELDK